MSEGVRIPIIKLNNGVSNYYPLSVGESTVTTHNIQVRGNIGGYQKDDIIPAVTTFDDILTTLFSGDHREEVIIDNRTIIKDPETDKICVNNEEVFKDIKCDEVIAESGKIINAISQADGIISVTTRDLTAEDIPNIGINQVIGLQDKIDELEQPLEVDDIPSGIPIAKIQDLEDRLEEEIDVSRIPNLEISKINGLRAELDSTTIKELGKWISDNEDVTNRVIWDGDQWLWKNDAGVYVTFDSGEPATTDYNATKLVINNVVVTRTQTENELLTEDKFFYKLSNENSLSLKYDYPHSIVGRIKSLENNSKSCEDLDEQLHSLISAEISKMFDKVKFNEIDSVELSSLSDLINVVKNILIKLGVPERNISINK